MNLPVNINRLTRSHLTTGHGKKPTAVPALLDQLEAAVTEQTTRGGEGAGGAAIPVGIGALSLSQDIEREARTHQEAMTGETVGTLIAILQSWANIEGEWAGFLEHVTQDWIDGITAIISPSKPPRRLHQPCPACGIMYGGDDMKPGLQVHCWDQDGAMLPPGDWTAECIHCNAAWKEDNMQWLTRAVNVA